MTESAINGQTVTGVWKKYLGWTTVSLLIAFLINNFLNIYFDFKGLKKRNIIGTEGYNGQNILIDLDNSRIVVTNSAATGWNVKTYMLNVIKKGKLPK